MTRMATVHGCLGWVSRAPGALDGVAGLHRPGASGSFPGRPPCEQKAREKRLVSGPGLG
jgi:hypothetical protein